MIALRGVTRFTGIHFSLWSLHALIGSKSRIGRNIRNLAKSWVLPLCFVFLWPTLTQQRHKFHIATPFRRRYGVSSYNSSISPAGLEFYRSGAPERLDPNTG